MAAPNDTGTEVSATPGEAAFPPFDPATFSSTLVWLALTFGALYLIMSRLALPRVHDILKNRGDKIRDDLSTAFRLREEANEASAVYEKTLAEARSRSQALAQETRLRVKHDQDARRHELEAELNGKLQTAETQIAERKASAMASVGLIATEAAAAIVQHISGRPADAGAVASAIADAKL